MISHEHLLSKSNYEYPYITTNRIVISEDCVDFIYQFVKDSNSGAKKYNYENTWSIEDTCSNIIGPPTEFPNYGKFSKTLHVSYNSFDISISPYQKEPYSPHASLQCIYCNKPHDNNTIRLNYIDLEFHEAVYPIRVSIYEVYKPGYVTQIFAQDSNKRWFELWTGPTQHVPSRSRMFSPPLQFCDFKTKILRLNFVSYYENYTTHLDAVELIGTSNLILHPEKSLTDLLKFINWKYPCEKDIHNLTPDHKMAYYDICDLESKYLKCCSIKSDIPKDSLEYRQKKDMRDCNEGYYNDHYHYNRYYNCFLSKPIKDNEVYWNKSKEQSRCSLSALPDEIILKIFKELDIRSLCRISQANKRLNNLTRDSFLITSLNLRHLRNRRYMDYLAPRCEALQQLDLTSSNISVSYFNDFLNICGKQLTHLRLRECQFLDNSALLQISKICKNLKVLDLSYCNHENENDGVTDEGFLYLQNLEFLENLNLRCTFNIRAESLCKILQKNRRMRDLNLSGLNRLREYMGTVLLDTVAIQLKNSCPDLEVINLGGNNITSLGIDALAECKNLRKLNLSWMNPRGHEPYEEYTIDKPSLRRLFSSCLLLEEVNLTHLKDDFLEELTLCKNLKQVYLDVPREEYRFINILGRCPKLQTIYVSGPSSDGGIVHDVYVKYGGSYFPAGVAQSKDLKSEYPDPRLYTHLPVYESDYGDYYFEYEYDDDDDDDDEDDDDE